MQVILHHWIWRRSPRQTRHLKAAKAVKAEPACSKPKILMIPWTLSLSNQVWPNLLCWLPLTCSAHPGAHHPNVMAFVTTYDSSLKDNSQWCQENPLWTLFQHLYFWNTAQLINNSMKQHNCLCFLSSICGAPSPGKLRMGKLLLNRAL